jgi:hypothetical protein
MGVVHERHRIDLALKAIAIAPICKGRTIDDFARANFMSRLMNGFHNSREGPPAQDVPEHPVLQFCRGTRHGELDVVGDQLFRGERDGKKESMRISKRKQSRIYYIWINKYFMGEHSRKSMN